MCVWGGGVGGGTPPNTTLSTQECSDEGHVNVSFAVMGKVTQAASINHNF